MTVAAMAMLPRLLDSFNEASDSPAVTPRSRMSRT